LATSLSIQKLILHPNLLPILIREPAYKIVNAIVSLPKPIVSTKDLQIKVSELKVDKLSLTLNIDDPQERKDTEQNIREATLNDKSSDFSFFPQWTKGYQSSVGVVLNTHSTLLIQANPKLENMPFFRVEFNPATAGKTGTLIAKDIIDFFLLKGFNQMAKYGNISRIDLAVDVLNVKVDELLAESTGSKKSGMWCGPRGNIETLYIGSKYSNWRACIYDKKHCLKEKGLPYPHHETTRIECQIKPKCSVNELSKIKNSFKRVNIYNCGNGSELPKSLKMMWNTFLDSCRYRGAQAALMLIQDRNARKKYRDLLIQHLAVPWFDPDEIWKQWPSVSKIFESEVVSQ
jgi:hypothetical protein